MELLSWLAKNTKQVAISDGWLGRPIGEENESCASSFMVDGMRGVQTVDMVSWSESYAG